MITSDDIESIPATPAARQAVRAAHAASDGDSVTMLALPEWDGWISPVFDVAKRLMVVHVVAGAVASWRWETLPAQAPGERAAQLAQWRIEKLLCGGISEALRDALERSGVTVIPHLCGCVQGVLQAYLDNQLADGRFTMPGCRAGRRTSRRNGGFLHRHRFFLC